MNYNILSPRGRPVKQLPVAHKKSQSPGASGRALSAHPVIQITVILHAVVNDHSKLLVLLVELERVLNRTTCTCMYVHYTMQRIMQSVQYDKKQI